MVLNINYWTYILFLSIQHNNYIKIKYITNYTENSNIILSVLLRFILFPINKIQNSIQYKENKKTF